MCCLAGWGFCVHFDGEILLDSSLGIFRSANYLSSYVA